MKKVLFLGVLSLLLVSLFSCNKDDDDNKDSNNLTVESKRLKVEAVGNQSLFEPVKFALNIPIGSTIEDATFGNVEYQIDSAAFFHRNDTGAVKRIAGELNIVDQDTLEFNTSARLFLDESYYFYVYCSYYKAGTSEKIKENGSYAVIARWAEYVPTVVAGKDVIFSSTMNGEETNIINPYNGDMIVDFKVPVLFEETASATSDIALLYRSISVSSNSGEEYVIWEREDDTANVVFNFKPIFPEDKQNMIGGVYYTVNMQFDYLVNDNGSWKHMMNSYGDTAIWNYNQAYKTDELFVPKDIVTAALPAEGDVNIDTVPTFYFSESHLTEVVANGITFRPVLKTFNVSDGQLSHTNYKWLKKDESSAATADSVVVMLDIDSLLLPSTAYDINFEANWQFKKDTGWYNIIEEDTIKREVFNIEVETINPAPGKQTFVSLNPTGEGVHMDADIVCEFISELGTAVSVEGMEMRPNIESFTLYQGSNIVSERFEVAEDKKSATLILDSLLVPTTEYEAVILAYWEYKDINGSWKRITQDAGNYYVEGDTAMFETFSVPGSVVKNIQPSGSRVDLNLPFEINLIGANNVSIEKEGIEFRPVFIESEFSVKKDDVVVPGTASWNSAEDIYKYETDSMLYASSAYNVSTKAYWEYKDGDTWKAVKDNGEVRYENLAKVVNTVETPEAVVASITPNRTGTALNDTIIISLNRNNGEEIDFGGTKYKLVLNDAVLVADIANDTVSGTFSWLDADSRMMIPSEYLQTSTNYTTTARGYWEYLRNGKWFKVGDEVRSVSFTTAGVPGNLFTSITPAGGVVPADTTLAVTMGGVENVSADGIAFKRVVDEFVLKQDTTVINDTFTYSGSTVSLNNATLAAGTDYSISFTAHWEYQLENGTWIVALKEDGTEESVTRNVFFTTED